MSRAPLGIVGQLISRRPCALCEEINLRTVAPLRSTLRVWLTRVSERFELC
jgi:hypothetical protein